MKLIHVAGSNGKGSVCAYLSSILTTAGKQTGLFTSPHLVDINERFQINQENVSNELFLEAFEGSDGYGPYSSEGTAGYLCTPDLF